MSYDLQTNNIPLAERTERYTCNICKQTFERVFPRRIVCMVIHPPGTCCHYGDTIITTRQLQKEREVQQVVEQSQPEKESTDAS